MLAVARRSTISIGLAALTALLCAATVLSAPPAMAAETVRIAGADRFATAAEVSRSHFRAGVPVAYIVTGEDFPDALAAGPAAAREGGPVLLTARDRLPASTADELGRLRPGRIVVVGGASTISDRVADELRGHTNGTVTRLAGHDRYGTAAAVSAAVFPAANTVFVASGRAFPDALAAAPAAHRADAPLLLVGASSVPPVVADELRRLGARRVVILGGAASVDATAEAQLREIVPDVSRLSGADRTKTSVAVSHATFGAGTPVAYLATAGVYADALSGGAVAALGGGPVLLSWSHCIPPAVHEELERLQPGRVVLLGGTSALSSAVEQRQVCQPPTTPGVPTVTPAPHPAWDDDAADPHVVRFGDTWYAYTTGNAWGNHIGVLTSSRPDSGWRTVTGQSYGSTALGNIPSWQQRDTQWAPGVYFYAGRYVMFYAAQVRAHGAWCLSVATASSPVGPFRDDTSGPIVCQTELGGSIDPHPFVDADGRAWLHWKNNDGFTRPGVVSRVWAAPLAADGVTIAGPHHEVMAKDTGRYPWQTTLDNPQMVLIGGVHYLFHTGGDYEHNDTYTTGYAKCAGPTGPCTTDPTPILGSYDNVAGPGGGTVAQDAAGGWWISYHAWSTGCYSYSCGGKRKLYVAPLTFR